MNIIFSANFNSPQSRAEFAEFSVFFIKNFFLSALSASAVRSLPDP